MVKRLKQPQIVAVGTHLPDPQLINQADGFSAPLAPVSEIMDAKQIAGIAADRKEQLILSPEVARGNTWIQRQRQMIGNLLGHGVTPSRKIEAWRQKLGRINLRNYVFELEMRAAEGQPLRCVSLREDQYAGIMVIFKHEAEAGNPRLVNRKIETIMVRLERIDF